MNMFDRGYDDVFRLNVRPKRPKTKDLKARKERLQRVLSGSPEVVVKVSGAGKGAEHVKAHLDYVTRNGELQGEDERGNVIDGRDEVSELHREWMGRRGKTGERTRDTINIVLSMPEGTDPKAVMDGAREFAKEQFADNHRYLMVLHTFETDPGKEPAPQPHVHLTVKALGFDGKRLNPRKADLQEWREAFAEKMREQGVDAEATPRTTRGVVQKAERSVFRHMQKRGVVPDRVIEQVKDAVEQLTNPKARPWEAAIEAARKRVTSGFLAIAKELSQGDASDKTLAARIPDFLRAMPPMQTARHAIQEQTRNMPAREAPEQGRE